MLAEGKPCQTNYCPDCVKRNVFKIVRCLHLVNPLVFFTISDVAPDHATALRRMKNLRQQLRKKADLRFADLYVLERYTEVGRPGLHLHGYGHGDFPDEHQLLRAAAASGMNVHRSDRPVDVQPMNHHLGLDYCFKRARNEVTLKSFLDDNGGNLVHTSRGFWRVPGQAPATGGYRGLLRQQGSASRA